MTSNARIRPRDRDAILQSLAAGVVPRRGLQHIQVGRAAEVGALLQDIARVGDGGSAVRFVIGDYGAGKSFFLHLVRSAALEKGLVTMHADLSPDRRLFATGGQARGLYAELARNAATRSAPDGGALPSVVERFVTSAVEEASKTGGDVPSIIRDRLNTLSEMVGGFDFAQVIGAYWRGHETGNEDLKSAAVRWLRGEYTTKPEARAALGVRTIVDDSNVYDMLKLLARFTSLAGYGGLLIVLDEMVNLYKLAHTQARTSNYEQLLRVVNDCLQGSTCHVGFVMGGTPEFLTDSRRGLYSYEALRSRLSENPFAVAGARDLTGPIVRLASLTAEELYVLLQRLRHVHAGGEPGRYAVPDEALHAFMQHCDQRVGAAYFRTPRSSIRSFIHLLSVLEQNQGADWREMLGAVELASDDEPDLNSAPEEGGESTAPTKPPVTGAVDPTPPAAPHSDDELSTFRL